MSYINRDAAMKKLFQAIYADENGDCDKCAFDEQKCMYDKALTRMEVCEMIENVLLDLPAADVTERKTGKWIPAKEPPWLDCSECGQDSVEYTNYCTNCGARMVSDEHFD